LSDSDKPVFGHAGQIDAFRKELPDQAVRVLVGPALPGTIGFRKVDLQRGFGRQLLMLGELLAVVQRERLPQGRASLGVTAPPTLIPKGIYAISVWGYLLLGKSSSHRPTAQTIERFHQEGSRLSAGTIVVGREPLNAGVGGDNTQPLATSCRRASRRESFGQTAPGVIGPGTIRGQIEKGLPVRRCLVGSA
jgi:hypothetical protein